MLKKQKKEKKLSAYHFSLGNCGHYSRASSRAPRKNVVQVFFILLLLLCFFFLLLFLQSCSESELSEATGSHSFSSLAILEAIFLNPIDVPEMRLKRTPFRERRGSLHT